MYCSQLPPFFAGLSSSPAKSESGADDGNERTALLELTNGDGKVVVLIEREIDLRKMLKAQKECNLGQGEREERRKKKG